MHPRRRRRKRRENPPRTVTCPARRACARPQAPIFIVRPRRRARTVPKDPAREAPNNPVAPRHGAPSAARGGAPPPAAARPNSISMPTVPTRTIPTRIRKTMPIPSAMAPPPVLTLLMITIPRPRLEVRATTVAPRAAIGASPPKSAAPLLPVAAPPAAARKKQPGGSDNDSTTSSGSVNDSTTSSDEENEGGISLTWDKVHTPPRGHHPLLPPAQLILQTLLNPIPLQHLPNVGD
mmetsp:Transcript_27215/g.44647  ORF Transcript_27215/g.44647 Transcript_27215/m.44647 type:complete len:236 (-) Transcript_27215:171-878(-)